MFILIFCLLLGWFIFTAHKAYGNVKLLASYQKQARMMTSIL